MSNLNTAMMVRSDARAIGMMTATRPGGTRKQPRLSSAEHTSDCVVTTANGDQYTIKRGTRRSKTVDKVVRTAQVKRDNAQQYERMLKLGAIGNVE